MSKVIYINNAVNLVEILYMPKIVNLMNGVKNLKAFNMVEMPKAVNSCKVTWLGSKQSGDCLHGEGRLHGDGRLLGRDCKQGGCGLHGERSGSGKYVSRMFYLQCS